MTLKCDNCQGDMKSVRELMDVWNEQSSHEGAAFTEACRRRYGDDFSDVAVCQCSHDKLCETAKQILANAN